MPGSYYQTYLKPLITFALVLQYMFIKRQKSVKKVFSNLYMKKTFDCRNNLEFLAFDFKSNFLLVSGKNNFCTSFEK